MKALFLNPLPPWVRALAALLAGLAVFLLGQLQGERHAGAAHINYVSAQALAAGKAVKAEIQVVTKTETEYRDRIKTIYLKGDAIEKQVPVYVSAADSNAFGVNAGFVRLYDASWSGAAVGPAAESDREPAGVSLAEIAETDAHNAASCLAWREQAVGLKEHFGRLQVIFNSQVEGK